MSRTEALEGPQLSRDASQPERSRDGRVTEVYLRFVRLALCAAVLLPFVVIACSWALGRLGWSALFWLPVTALAFTGTLAVWGLGKKLARSLEPVLEELGEAQARFLDGLSGGRARLAIALSAGLSLFLELAVIRWQGTEWEVLAFYKNFSLLGCFLGLGLGYALARRRHIPSVVLLPVLAFQVVFMVSLLHGIPSAWLASVHANPFVEQLSMGVATARGAPQYVAIYGLLTVVLLTTALAFIPIGQLCGRALERLRPLDAYGWNLAGSLAGVALMFVVSALWTPPVVWFAVVCLGLAWLQSFEARMLLSAMVWSTLLLVALAWPVKPGWERIYSPYQLLERGPGERGLPLVLAAGHYLQPVLDLSTAAQAAFPERRNVARYYELPYHLRPGAQRAVVVGAGTGNDVAAALRSGVRRLDAVEIDPAIVRLGMLYHPERPYGDPRVTVVVNDARTFLRSSRDSFDLIVYGLLDSHTLLSHASSIRLDSFVYTVEALRDARARLAPGGMLSLSFAVLSPELGRKIYLMMQQAFDGHAPVSLTAGYGSAVTFAQSKEGDLRPDPTRLAAAGFAENTAFFADPTLKADVSTDDWPFFYMARRVYPRSYLGAVGLLLAISLLLHGGFQAGEARWATLPFFFLGAGFMLVETKGITELGLAFGNTWQVIGIVIGAILIMAWLGNWIVTRSAMNRPTTPWILLLIALAAGLVFVRAGAVSSSLPGRWMTALVLMCPLFFSGIAFSTLLSTTGVASALGMNLLGAMVGGVLEYNSMYFGFQSLYWLAISLYGAGLLLLVTGTTRSLSAA